MKTCTKCGILQDDSNFVKDKHKKDGLSSNCKTCRQAYRDRNRTYIRKRDNAFYHANKEHIKPKRQVYREKNREAINEYARQHYQDKQEQILKKKKSHRKKLVDTLSDQYIINQILKAGWELDREDIPDELIQMYRLQIQVHRTLKEKANDQ